jgi:hypothetical protein
VVGVFKLTYIERKETLLPQESSFGQEGELSVSCSTNWGA